MSSESVDQQVKIIETTRISQCLEQAIIYKAECVLCGEETEEECRPLHLARVLYNLGWRYGTSAKYQTDGLMCPTCLQTPDEER